MGISRLTAYIIAENEDISVVVSGPSEDGKYAGQIFGGAEQNFRLLLSTPAVFSTREVAQADLERVVKEVRDFVAKERSESSSPIANLFGSQEGEVVSKIIEASKQAPD